MEHAIEHLQPCTEAEVAAGARSRLYQLLSLAFAFPDRELFEAVRDGIFADAVREAENGLPYDIGGVASLARAEGVYEDFESEYIRIFDVGPSGPPCPLYGGVYVGDRMKVMEDAVRFYNFFHLRLSPEMHELPDHLTTELEFLHYLTYRELEARQHGIDPTPLLRAERDFLTRHPCKWLPRMRARLAKQQTHAFFPALAAFAQSFFDADRAWAASAAG